MKKKNVAVIIIILIIAMLIVISCIISSFIIYKLYEAWKDRNNNDTFNINLSDSLDPFESDEEFYKFVSSLKEEDSKSLSEGFGDLEESVQMPSTSEDTSKQESITNVQEVEVDEGDIIKAYKNYLLILRRGKMFSIKLGDNSSSLKVVSSINSYPRNFTQGTWYDEMILNNNTIVVIGYSYDLSATEVGLFEITDEGILSHKNSFYIDSNDYYSSRNYTSRLIDGELIFYMPYYLYSYEYNESSESQRKIALPQVRTWIKDNEISDGKDILNKTDIYKPLQKFDNPTLHTIVRCDLNQQDVKCNAKAILGPYSRNFYVSENAVYLWISNFEVWGYDEDEQEDNSAYVYMFLLEDLSARALIANGTPIDQFSFKEENDYLNVLVREYSEGDVMWSPEYTYGNLALFRTEISNFSNEPKEISKDDFTILPYIDSYSLQNRFVGDYLLYGAGSDYWYGENDENKNDYILYIKKYKTETDPIKISLTHSIERIDILDTDAVAIGSDGDNLVFSSIILSENPKYSHSFTVENAMQGEVRSHGFFYKEIDNNNGILGLPIRIEGDYYEHLINESAEVIFLNVNNEKEFLKLGTLISSPDIRSEDDCSVSCVDWYGNSRPIFYNERIFALLGNELIEGELSDNKITELNRISF